MRRRTVIRLALTVTLALAGIVPFAPEGAKAAGGERRKLVVVVNPDNPVTNIDIEDLKDIYFGKRRFWASGGRVHMADLVERKTAEEASAFARFAADYLGKDLDTVKNYWIKIIFSGAGQPPKQLKSAAEVVEFVAANEGGLGYLYADEVTPDVKVVAVSRPES